MTIWVRLKFTGPFASNIGETKPVLKQDVAKGEVTIIYVKDTATL